MSADKIVDFFFRNSVFILELVQRGKLLNIQPVW